MKMFRVSFVILHVFVMYSNCQMRPGVNWDQRGFGSRGFGQGSDDGSDTGRNFFGNNFRPGQMFPRRPFSGESQPPTAGTLPGPAQSPSPGQDTFQLGQIPGMEDGDQGRDVFGSGPQPPISRRPVEIPGPGSSAPRPPPPEPDSEVAGPVPQEPDTASGQPREPTHQAPREMAPQPGMEQRPMAQPPIPQNRPLDGQEDLGREGIARGQGQLAPPPVAPETQTRPGERAMDGSQQPPVSELRPEPNRLRPIRQDENERQRGFVRQNAAT